MDYMSSGTKQVQIRHGQMLTFRRPKSQDAKQMLEYLDVIFSESDNLLHGSGEFKLTVAQEEEFIEKTNKDNNSLMLLGTIDEQIVSIANIVSASAAKIKHNAEVAISVRKSHWRLGVGYAMMMELIEFASQHGIKNIRLGVKADNQKAIKLYEKCGFAKIGVLKDFFKVDGKYYDEILMVLQI